MKYKAAVFACVGMLAFSAAAFTTASVPSDGVYKFTFGVSETQDGSIPVPASAFCDVNGTMEKGQFSYGFLGTTDDSYKNDVPSSLPTVPHAIDGFKVVKGQKIVLHDTADANGVPCVTGPAAREYLPGGASSFEGRYPVRFSMRAEERAYYAVTCTVANASSTANADVTLFSERCHTHAQHLVLAPGETKTFAWSVELAPNYFKTPKKAYDDNAVNVVVVGENAALASLTVVKQPQTAGTVRGGAVANMNVGRTMWLCDDSTGTDQRCDTPYFTLQNYSGVGSGLSRWAPANLSIRNQGEGGLATGANTHRQSCLLKPGDYLYVEYGHNEASTESYTNNLETYLADANTAGANLVIVSPLERHYSWDADNSKWNRTLQGYAEAGEAWVEAKIAAGATNVAFIDLNKPFADWMNAELVRINGINPSIPLKNAIDYYFFSAKGGKVDATHPNPAGSDWGAYFVWSNALERVAAGEAEGATDSQRIQAAVLKGITEGVQLKVGLNGSADNTPWLVSDEIITAGKASNSYWDATVRAGYDYAKDAAVAAVDATCENGVVTLRGVTMRVMNQVNYTKAVIDIVSADTSVTNRYWSYYNYDASGNSSGELVVPEVAGFIDEDLDKDDADIASHVSQTLTIASGGKAYIWFAEANGNTWQVGDNAPCSAIYPLEAWTDACLADSCADASTWETTTQAEIAFETVDGEDGISFTSSGANSSGQGKNCGFTRALDSQIASGRIRVSFKARFDDGMLVFALSNTKGTTTWPMEGGEQILTLNGSASVFGSAGPYVTVTADDTPALQTAINAGEWMDVDMILDLDALRAEASVGGSDYRTFAVNSVSHTPYKYFGITLANGKAHAGAIDDVKIVALAPTPQVTVAASANNAAFGSVAINGTVAAEATAFVGSDVALTAVSADVDMYAFDHWEDAEGNNVSTKQTLVIEAIAADCAYTAVFREYAHDENRTTTWDFSDYAVASIFATANQTVDYNGMSIFLQNGDTITGDGIRWANVTTKDSTVSTIAAGSAARHFEFTPLADGTLSISFKMSATGAIGGNGKPVYVNLYAQTEEGMKDATATVTSTDASTFQFDVTKGTKYVIWSYYYNRDSVVTVSSVAYSYAPTYITAAAAVNNANYGSATAGGVAAVEVLVGREVTFAATPASSAYSFVNWTDGEGNIVSTEATFVVPVSADVAYTANFEKTAAGDVVEMRYDFASFAGNNSVTESGNQKITTYGPFEIYTSDSNRDNDSITENGIFWHVPANDIYYKKYNADQPCDYVHYIKFTAPVDGAVSIVFKTDTVVSNRKLSLCVSTGELSGATWNNKISNVEPANANTDYILTQEVTAGTTYWFWCASQNWDAGNAPTATTISSITYSHSPDPTTLTVANSDAQAGTVTVNGASITEAIDVQKGEYVHLVATPNAGGLFGGWKNDSEEVVSMETDFWLCVEESTSLTATWRTVNTHAFTWNWNVSEGDWNDPANWLYEGIVPATTCPNDAESDYVTFNTAATVNLGENVYVKEMWANEDVTFEGGKTISLKMSTGDGKLTLNGVGLSNVSGNSMVVSNDLAIAGTDASWFNALSSTVELRGAISGGAPMNFWLNDNSSSRVRLYGNNNDYTGDAKVTGGLKYNRRSVFCFENEYAAGTNAYWTVEYNAAEYNKNEYRMVKGTTRFGGYWGEISDTQDGTKLIVGYLNRDSYMYLIDINSGREFDVVKVGTANLKFGTALVRNLDLQAGSVTPVIGTAFNTLTFAADTTIYLAGDETWTAGTVTNLFSYTKLAGAGTLAEQVEVTGLAEGLVAKIAVVDKMVTATIEAAEVAPTTNDENAKITKNGDGAYTVQVEAETVAITVPNGVTVSEVVVSPDTATVTGVPANAKVKVAVSWEGGSANYEIVDIGETGAVTLNEDAVVTVGEEQIALKPELSDAGDEVAPLEVGEGVSVGVKSIPGLVYRLARGTAVDAIDTSAANAVKKVKATSSRVSLADDDPPADGAFYKVTVELK